MSENPTPAAPEIVAADVFRADLEGPDHENVVAKAGRFVAELASAAFGDDGSAFSGVAVVVRRIDDHEIVFRLDPGNYESDESVLQMVREDLASLSPEDFVSTWGTGEAPHDS